MSSTKIVIIVLVLIGLLFVIFVARGALRTDSSSDPDKVAKGRKPEWSKTIKGLFSSLQPKITLKQTDLSGHFEDTIKPDNKQPFRTITFVWRSGKSSILYVDPVPVDDKYKKLQRQRCPLPNPDGDDSKRCSIVVLKDGGTLTFDCDPNTSCAAKVE
jgi:hypothetical protein